jgi:hypothetical protein
MSARGGPNNSTVVPAGPSGVPAGGRSGRRRGAGRGGRAQNAQQNEQNAQHAAMQDAGSGAGMMEQMDAGRDGCGDEDCAISTMARIAWAAEHLLPTAL